MYSRNNIEKIQDSNVNIINIQESGEWQKLSRDDKTNVQELVANNEHIQNIYGEYSYGSRPFGSGVQAQANIIATAISATQNNTPCTEGTCIVDISVTWTNTGGTDGSFVPNITIDGTPADPTYQLETLAGNNKSITHVFTVSGLTNGDHLICPIPNE